ncbi:phosphatase PAP2 family protein [Clostridium sp. PL3]|uniref:Phosphatase PAP2 family protein n=1 Tax=Clostridium thailandense TaxID=2794346 RepID=A0A949TZM1_9CLOT|nr:phosphatase PAP2 family protein [Clostridium thailandense]MBV7274570.1 phosphatase PAP2 family protein [Clostridium thailandense]
MSQINLNRLNCKSIKEKNTLFMCFVITLILILLVICSIIITEYFRTGQILLDIRAINYVYSIRTKELNKFAIAVTNTGNPVSIIIATIVISLTFYFLKKKKESVFYFLNILGIWILNESIKTIFKRQRPDMIKLVHASGYSFPSGHSMVFMTVSLVLVLLIINYISNRYLAFSLSLLIIVYGFMIGISRVYVGVHYLSDVISGWTFSAVWTLISIIIYKKTVINSESAINYNNSDINNNYSKN